MGFILVFFPVVGIGLGVVVWMIVKAQRTERDKEE